MAPEAYITHLTPERVRLRVPSRKGDPAWFEALRQASLNLPDVRHAEVNPTTGSLLLRFETGRMAPLSDAARVLNLRLETPQRLYLDQEVSRALGDVSERLRDFTGGDWDLRSFAFLGLLATAFYQLSVGNFAVPAWYVAFWYAMSLSNGRPRQ